MDTENFLAGNDETDRYVDIEDYNTSSVQMRKRRKLLQLNVDNLTRKKRRVPKVNPNANVLSNPSEYEQMAID